MSKRDNTYCCVPQCKSRGNNSNLSFHKFPSEKTNSEMRRRQLWIRMLRIGKEVTNRMSVCSKHFKRSDYILPDLPTNRPHLKRIAIPSLCLPQTISEETETVVNKEKSSKKSFNSVARKKIRNVKIGNSLVSSTNSTPEEKEERKRIAAEALLKLEGTEEANLIETITPDKTGDGEENVLFHRPSNSEDIFGQYVASEMRTLKVDPLLYLQTKQAILETLTSANFELINSL